MTNRDKLRLYNRIAKLEDKLELLKAEYIVKYGYCDLYVDPDSRVTESPAPEAP